MSSQIKLPVSFKDRLPVEADLPFVAYSSATPIGQKPPAVCGWLSFYQPSTLVVVVPSQWHPSYTHFLPGTTTKPTQTPDQLIAQFVGEGYRLLGKTELIEEGDQWHNFGDVWNTTQRAGRQQGSGTYRRKVAATKPNLWRQLDRSEKVLEGDVLVEESSLDHATVDLTADKIPNSRPSVNWMARHGGKQASHGVYFRRLPAGPAEPVKLAVDPGEGYVLLAEGTTLETGDEYFFAGTWDRANYGGTNTVGGKGCEYPYRRKIKVATPAIEPGAGYRLLGDDEEILPTDEYFNPDATSQWKTDDDGGDTPRDRRSSGYSGLQFRRKLHEMIDPGAGYRLLVKGEKILPTDQFRSIITPNTWADTVFAGKTVGEGLASGFTYRRKVEVPAPAPVAPEPQITIPAGYRTLKVGDLFAATDKAFYKSSGQVRELASWLVGNVVKDHDLIPGLPILWLRPITTAAASYTEAAKPTAPVFKVGDRVRLLGGWYDSPSNPIWDSKHGKVIGTITSVAANVTALPLVVRWDNAQINSYRPDNLGLHVDEQLPHHQTGKLPPAGYRWLKEGETREVGDVYEDLSRIVPGTVGWEISSCDCILRPLVTAPAPAVISGVSTQSITTGQAVYVSDTSSHDADIYSRDKKIAELEKHVANLQRKGQRQREALNKQQDSIKRLQEEKAQASLEHSCALETYKRQQNQSAIIAHGKTAWDVRRVFDDRPAARLQSIQDLANTPGAYQVLSTEQAKALTSYVDALESTLTRIAL